MTNRLGSLLALVLVAAALAPAAAMAQPDRTITAGGGPTFSFEGASALGTNVTTEAGPPECSKLPPTYCDMTLIELEQPGLYTFNTDVPDSSDIDTFLYESDETGTLGKLLTEGSGFIGDDETFAYDAEPGYVMFVAAYYFSLQAGFTVNGTFEGAAPPAPPAGDPPAAPAANRAPEATIAGLAKAARSSKLRRFRGTAEDVDGKVAKVEVGLVQRTRDGGCRQLTASGRFGSTGKCLPSRFLRARGTSSWSFSLRRRLPKGKYVLYARAIDDKGAVQGGFSPASKRSFTVR